MPVAYYCPYYIAYYSYFPLNFKFVICKVALDKGLGVPLTNSELGYSVCNRALFCLHSELNLASANLY